MLSWSGVSMCTAGRLRTLRPAGLVLAGDDHEHVRCSALDVTTPASAVRAPLVDGASPSTSAEKTCTRPWRARSDSAPRRAAAFIFFGVRWS